jgi:hypothetical protein
MKRTEPSCEKWKDHSLTRLLFSSNRKVQVCAVRSFCVTGSHRLTKNKACYVLTH